MTDSLTSSSSENLSQQAGISATVDRLRQLTQLDIQSYWQYCLADFSIAAISPVSDLVPAPASPSPTWQAVQLNDRHHIAWAKGQQVLWLTQQITIPPHLSPCPIYPLHGLRLLLALTWWAESAQIYLNGDLVQEGDLFDCSARIVLSPAVQPGEVISVAIRLVSPAHDDGALVRSCCIYEMPQQEMQPCPEPGFVADELAVLQTYCTAFAPEKLAELYGVVMPIDGVILEQVESIDRQSLQQALSQLRQNLAALGEWIKERKIYLLGHAHLDLAWLWAIAETWQAAERTFNSVLSLQQRFPELTFGHSTPALYEWLEQNRPQLFSQIQTQIKRGVWEAIAGLWVEPELNTVSGESIARQVLYGQRYVQEKFGSLSNVAWLPDSFGFSAQLPQILRQGGVKYFVTQKLRWNDTTEFPHELFWWRSPSGDQLLSLHSAPIGTQIDPLKMADYACTWEAKTGLRSALWLPGVGDHGGGPTQDMLEVVRRWQQSPFFPQLEFTTATAFLDQVIQEIPPEIPPEIPQQALVSGADSLPIWDDELYLEFHRGCYTTHADQKRWNRRCEVSLYQAELFASIATLMTEKAYPRPDLEQAWKKVLFNQFHDILPGSAIATVYDDANQMWKEAYEVSEQIVDEALRSIAAQIELSNPPCAEAKAIVIFNPLGWQRSQTVELDIPSVYEEIRQYRQQGKPVNLDRVRRWKVCPIESPDRASPDRPRQDLIVQSRFPWQLTFLAEQIPAFGYRCFWLQPSDDYWKSSEYDLTQDSERYQLENDWLRVAIEPTTGDLASVWDKINQCEVLSGAGNQLQAFRDVGQYWDAWNIDPNYANYPLEAAQCLGIFPETRGAIATRIRVERQIGDSIFEQTYILEQHSPVLKIATSVNWVEKHILVKAAFPLNLDASIATYEIPYGAIQRPTRTQTAHDQTKWEVPALQWADLTTSEPNHSANGFRQARESIASSALPEKSMSVYGVSLLNDCKYGYDAQPNQLRLTLLRGTEWPNPNADRGFHQFTYALYPHCDRWQSAQTTRHAYELNQPLRVLTVTPKTVTPKTVTPKTVTPKTRNTETSPAETSSAETSPAETGTAEKLTMPALPTMGQFLNLAAENLILTAFKPAEESENQWILRCYECHGETATFVLETGLLNASLNSSLNASLNDNLKDGMLQRVTLLEQVDLTSDNSTMIQPWQIATFRLQRSRD